MNKSYNAYDTVAIGISQNKAKVYYQKLLKNGDNLEIGTAFSSCEKVVLDIKSLVNAQYAPDGKATKESVHYLLNEENPFDIIIPYSNAPKNARQIKGYISYSRSKNIIEINTRSIFNNGFFKFNLKLNFTSDGITRGKVVKQKPVMEITPTKVAENLFDGLNLRVDKKGAKDDALVIDEFKRFSQNRLINFSAQDEYFGCDRYNVQYSGSGEFVFDDEVNLKNVIIKNKATVSVPSGFPLISVIDRAESPVLENGLFYRRNSPQLDSSVVHKQYFDSNGVAFYDQVITRGLKSASGGGGRNHPLIHVRNIFNSVGNYEDVPILHFRREYAEREDNKNGKAPYHFYFCPKYVLPSESLASPIEMRVKQSALNRIEFSFSIGERSLNKIVLNSKTTVYSDAGNKFYYGSLEIDVTNATQNIRLPYGRSKVFYSDTISSTPLTDPEYGLTIMDVLHALQNNVSGKVNVLTVEGTGGGTHAGFVPTFSEIGIFSPSPNDPVVEFIEGHDFMGCAMMPAARMWNGNADNSYLTASAEESVSVTIEKGARSGRIYTRGLAHHIDLDNYVAIAPLSRAFTTPFVRGEIKSFQNHLEDDDFKPIESGGKGYNRFYKYNTIKKSIEVMAFGENYFTSMLNLPPNESEAMLVGGPASRSLGFGKLRKLVGASQIGVAFDFLGKTYKDQNGFFETTPAYIMSHIGFGEPSAIQSENLVKKLSDFSGGSNFISLQYKNAKMFPGISSHRASEYVPNPKRYGINAYGEDIKNLYNGGIFSSLYTTSGLGSHIEVENTAANKDSAYYSLSLDPFIFDNNALLCYEGGSESESPKRRIELSPCMKWIDNAPEKSKIICAFLRKEMIDWGKDRGWSAGKTLSFSFYSYRRDKNTNGILSITGSGNKDVISYLNYDVATKNISYSDNLGSSTFIGNTLQSFVDAHASTFNGLLSIEAKPVIRATDVMPYEDFVFNTSITNIQGKRPVVEITSEEPYAYPYSSYPYGVQSENPYASSLFNFVSNNFYSENIGTFEILSNPYSSSYDYPYDAYYAEPYYIEPYVNPYEPAPKVLETGLLMIYRNTVIPSIKSGFNLQIDMIQQNKYPRSYKFYLNNPKYNSLDDLIHDVNDRLSEFGIVANSLVENPKAYSASRLFAQEPKKIVEANYVFKKVYPFVRPSSFSATTTELQAGPYDAVSDIVINEYGALLDDSMLSSVSENSESVLEFTPNYDVVSNPYYDISSLENAYISPYEYPQFQQTFAVESFGKLPIVETEIITPEIGAVTFERIRVSESSKGSIDIEYDTYDSQYSQPDNINIAFVSKSTNYSAAKNQQIYTNRPRYTVGASDLKENSIAIASSVMEDENRFVESSDLISNNTIDQDYSNTSFVQKSLLLPPNVVALEVAYGGYISNGVVSTNVAPNTYFSNYQQSGIGDVQFRTVDADFALVLVRIAYNDGKYGPNNAAADDIASMIKATVNYNSPVDPEYVVGEFAPGDTVETVEFINSENVTETYLVFPIMLKIPLKSTVSYVNINMENVGLSTSVKIIDAPSELNNFGFLAINKNNPNYDMKSSKDGRTFGLVLDNYGFWDILIAPEGVLQTSDAGEFTFNGRGYSRTVVDTDDRFVAGIGTPIINDVDNDITGFDKSMIPESIRNSITLIPVPGYQQVWVLRIDPAVKSYLVARRKAAGGLSQDGCYVDIPIYFQANITEASGTCNVRIFNNVSCVFDYNFCDFFWNLGSPLQPPSAFVIQDSIEVNFIEYINCDSVARIIEEDGIQKVEIISYFIMNIDKIPMLDNGTSLLLIKTNTAETQVREIFTPNSDTIGQLRTPTAVNQQRPWEFDCSFIPGVDKINKTTLYTNPQNYLEYTIASAEIARGINTLSRFMLVQPKTKFPLFDEFGMSSATERVIASIGFVFKDWKPSATDFWQDRMIFGIKFVIPTGQTQPNLLQNFSIRFLYNEDRRLL